VSHLPPAFVDIVNFLIPASIFAIMALGLNLQWGHTGLFNAGVAAFWGLGAYAAAILMVPPVPPQIFYAGHLGFNQPFLVAAVGAMVVSGLAGLFIALPMLRLRADYFAIATLALAETVRLVLTNAAQWTGGSVGIHDIPRPLDAFAIGEPGLSDSYIAGLALLCLLISLMVVEFLTRQPWGRVLRGIREDEEATLALGKNVYRFRLEAFVLGCALMGLSGAVYATYLRFLAPNQFDPLATFNIYVIVILGGSGNNFGVVAGAYLFYAFDWVSVRLDDNLPPDWSLRFPYIRLMIIGALLVALVIYRPEGIFKEKKRTFPPVRIR
jgi:branched-chain amino acid transport system permease protein